MKFLRKKQQDEVPDKAADAAPENPAPARSEAAPERAQGVTVNGDALRGAWLQGAALLVVAAAALLAYLLLLRAPGQQAQVLRNVTENYAVARANAVAAEAAAMRRRVEAAVAAPATLRVIAGAGPDTLEDAERNLNASFPEAVSVRLLSLGAMGTTDLDGGDELRNHIEVDLVRRAAQGDEARPEAYQFDGRWLLSIAAMADVEEAAGRRAVVLVTLSEDTLGQWLTGSGEPAGQYLLQQRFNSSSGGSSDIEVISRGSGVDEGSASVAVPGTDWKIVFRPGRALLATAKSSGGGDVDLLAILAVLALGATVLIWRRSDRAVRDESQEILDAASQRSALALSVPALAPVARELRKASLRGGRSDRAGASPAGGGATTAALAAVSGSAAENLPTHIFRAYDIRGIADSELTDEVVFRVGSAVAKLAREAGEQAIILGHDGRESSERIHDVVEKALLRSGCDVVNIGLVPTPLLYFATHQLDAQSGIMVTGSHNPAEYNGLKIVLKRQTLAEGMIDRIREIAQSGEFEEGEGQSSQADILGTYIDEIAGDIALAVPLKVVVDAGNGAAGEIGPMLLEELGCEVVRLHCEIDGSFPNHGPDTSNDDNLKDLVAAVKANGADFGVAYDGDGDRLAVVTNAGDILRTDTLMMLFARDVVARNPGADVVYDVKCSRILAALINSLGGRPVLWKTGHALMKQKMLETGALLGGEFSGHVFFGERWYGFDDGIYATCRLAEIISAHELELDEMVRDLPKMVSTPEILVPVSEAEKFALIGRFVKEASFPEGKANDLDGLRVDFEGGWGLLRASNTSASLTARFEANNEMELQRIMGLFRQQLSNVAPDLDIPF